MILNLDSVGLVWAFQVGSRQQVEWLMQPHGVNVRCFLDLVKYSEVGEIGKVNIVIFPVNTLKHFNIIEYVSIMEINERLMQTSN